MKRSSFRTWRENRLIEKAMRDSPPPRPSEGLKDRLIQQAQSVEAAALPQPAHSRSRLVWIAPAAALVLVAYWVAFHSSVPEAKPKAKAYRALLPSRNVTKTSPKLVRTVVPKPRVAQRTWHPKLRNKRRLPRPILTVKQHPAQAPPISVSITRRPGSGVGYARVAAYSTDESGRKVKTAWTLIDNPKTRTSSQEMSGVDASGQRQLLKVAVVMPSNRSKGEEL